MKRFAVRLILGGGLLACAIGTMAASASSAHMADLKDDVQKIADAVASGDTEGAKKMAADLAKTASMDDVMHLFSMRKATGKSKGIGVGTKPGSITPDGIEAKITNLTKKALPKSTIAKEGDDLRAMAYRTAAIAEFAVQKAPAKDMGEKKKKDWLDWAEGMRSGSIELADALKAQDGAKVKTAASKVNSNCNNCHGTFRD